LGIRKRAETVIIFLTSSIPQTEANGFTIYHNICRVVIEPKALVSIASGNEGEVMINFISRSDLAGKGIVWDFRVETHTVGMYSPGNAFVV